MPFQVEHNPDQLQAAKRVIVHNVQRAQKLIRKIMDEKRPRGMRLRHSYDHFTNSVYLEAHNALPIEYVIHQLSADGNVVAIDRKRVAA